jgi:hypothetical protein
MNRALVIALSALVLACDGQPSNNGAAEPIRVPNGFFREGELPGLPVSEQPKDSQELLELTPRVAGITGGVGVVRPGQAGISLRGTSTEDAYSIAIKLADAGSGYWVKPVGAATLQPNERDWDARLDIGPDIEPGQHVLDVVAIDADGNAGPHAQFQLCVTRDFEHTRNACDPTVLPPAGVISLSWQNDADLDLVVVTPSGLVVDATNPTTLDLNGGEDIDPEAPGVGLLSVDSNGACRRDGVQRESLTWNTSPERGSYEVYARLFEPCGAGATQLKVEAFVRTAGEEEDTFDIELITEPVHGLLAPQNAGGRADLGLFVTTIEFP